MPPLKCSKTSLFLQPFFTRFTNVLSLATSAKLPLFLHDTEFSQAMLLPFMEKVLLDDQSHL